MVMNKHKFNIFPEAKKEDFERLKADIDANGFDKSQPITTYEGAILDGWNRLQACEQLTITPVFAKFTGSAADAIAFVMRTNKRRNLNSGQWATIAAEADELMAAIAAEAAKNKGGRPKKSDEWPCHHCGSSHPIGDNPCHNPESKKPQQKIVTDKPSNRNVTDSKTAEMFNTNRTYVNNAVKMKEAAPEVFEKVKAGTMTMQDGMKAVRAIPTDPWSESERQRQVQVEKGLAVVANASADKNLITWAESNGKAMRVDRGTKYGNPFVLPDDGTRDHVCDCYEHNYLPNKPSITSGIDVLKGKVLICHCYPLRCHGDALAEMANGVRNPKKPVAEMDDKAAKIEANRLRKAADELDPPTKFVKPTVEDVAEYCQQRKNNIDAEMFVAHYAANGWKLANGNKLNDWKSAVITWEKRNDSGSQQSGRAIAGTGRIKPGKIDESQIEWR
jgi:hypothetical protein